MAVTEQVDRRKTERNMDLLMRYYVAQSEEEVSEAHSPTHLRTTARLTELVAILYGFSPKEGLDAHFAGDYHDLIRSPSEDPLLKDDQASARQAVLILNLMDERGLFTTTPEEKDAVRDAIGHHGEPPAFFLDPNTRDSIPQDLNIRIHAALFVADKIEANGARVIARRSSFVAGDRLHNPEGDWQQFGFRPNKDEALVVAIESLLRLGIINPQYIYPEKIRAIVDPLYEVQREFVRGVFKAKGLSVSDVATLLLERKRKDGKNMLAARKLSAPEQHEKLVKFLEERTRVKDGDIGAVSDDVANSAIETVLYFSRDYRVDMDGLISGWMPRGKAAENWRTQMLEYSSGNWFNQARQQISSNAINL